MGLLHDLLLRADVLLLPCVHNVPFLQDLHGKGFGLLTFELNLGETESDSVRNSET